MKVASLNLIQEISSLIKMLIGKNYMHFENTFDFSQRY